MHTDIRERLRDGAVTPRTEVDMARLLERSRRLRWRRRVGVLAVAAATVLFVSGVVVVSQRGSSGPITVATGGDRRGNELDVPPPGEVSTDFLDDGTPVFVVHDGDGAIRVVSAIDTHGVFGVRDLVWWCRSSERFEEPQSGTSYDARGRRSGGPAPASLVTYRSQLIRDGTEVRVGRPRPPGPEAPSALDGPVGPSCMGTSNLPAGAVARHEFPINGQRVLNPRQAVKRSPEEFVEIRGVLVVGDRDVRLCQHYDGLRCRKGVAIRDASPEEDIPAVVTAGGLFLGRVSGNQLTDVVFVEVAYEQSILPEYGFFIGLPTSHLEVQVLPALTFQSREFDVEAGVVQIDFVSLGGTHTLAIDAPLLSSLRLTASGDTGPTSALVRLEPGTYAIFDDIPGHRAAGEEARIKVTRGAGT